MTPDIDPFEEFEFRPLTEGLGFHGKPADAETDGNLAAPKKSLPLSASALSESGPDLPVLKAPLPRKEKKPEPVVPIPSAPPPPPLPRSADDLLQSLQKKPWDFQSEKATELVTCSHDFSALVLDAMLLIAGFLTCLIVLLVVTKVDLLVSLTTPGSGPLLTGLLVGLFAFLCWAYMVISRVFLGASPGEWVFDQQLTAPDGMGRLAYVGHLMARTILVILSGFVVLPIMSWFARHDVLGRWLGVELKKAKISPPPPKSKPKEKTKSAAPQKG